MLTIGSTRIAVVGGDISALDVDAVVNAANRHLQLGSGVAGAIRSRGGPTIQEECDAWLAAHGPLSPDQAAVTAAGDMPAQMVVHVAGPVGEDPGHLAAAVGAALDATAGAGARTVALPAISAGVFGYPPDRAAAVIVETTVAWVTEHADALDEVLLVGFGDEGVARFATALDLHS